MNQFDKIDTKLKNESIEIIVLCFYISCSYDLSFVKRELQVILVALELMVVSSYFR